jgi:nucleoside phosphorylase
MDNNIEQKIKIVVISALREELNYLLAKKEELNWQEPVTLQGKYSYHLGTLKNKEGQTCQIAAIPQPLDEMGLIDAAILSTIAISKLKPEYIILIGICGGIEGSVNIGDIVIPRQAFHYQSGKLQGTGELKKGIIDEKSDGRTISKMLDFFDLAKLNEILKSAIDMNIKLPSLSSISVHSLNIASADLVNDHPDSIRAIEKSHDRKAIAFDMESLAVLKAAAELDTKAVIIKSVSDIPTKESSRETQENYRDFAKFAATEAFYKFATESKFFFNLENIDTDSTSKLVSIQATNFHNQQNQSTYSQGYLQTQLDELGKDYEHQKKLQAGYRQQLRILSSVDVDSKLRLEHKIKESQSILDKLDLEISSLNQKIDSNRNIS